MNNLLFDEAGQLRSGWRAAIFLFAFAFVSAASHGLILFLASGLGDDETTVAATTYFLSGTFSAAAALIIGWLCGWRFEGLRSFKAIGAGFSNNWFRNFLLGSFFGILSFGFAVSLVLISGSAEFRFDSSSSAEDVASSLAASFAVFGAMSAFEEALFRGYVLQTFTRSDLAWLAILLTSVFFGAVHLDNPNATIISTVNTILAGIWFSHAYLKTRDLWFVWGLHLMWNWSQGSIFGVEVSGLTEITPNPFLREIDAGPAWLTGGSYGIEGGVACTVALVLSMLAIYVLPMQAEPTE